MKHVAFCLVFVMLTCSVGLILMQVNAQNLRTRELFIASSHQEKLNSLTEVLVDPTQKNTHKKALADMVHPAICAGKLNRVEDFATSMLKDSDAKIRAQAHAVLGDVLLHKGEIEQAKENYQKAVELDSEKGRHFANRLWDMEEKEESIITLARTIKKQGITLEDCLGENSFLRKAFLIEKIPQDLNLFNDQIASLVDYAKQRKSGNVNPVWLESRVLPNIKDENIKTTLRIKNYLYQNDTQKGLDEWDTLNTPEKSETAKRIALILCDELQFDHQWPQSIQLAEHVLDNTVSELSDEQNAHLLYRIALANSWLRNMGDSIEAAQEAVDRFYPHTTYGQRAVTTLCLRQLIPDEQFDAAEAYLTQTRDCAINYEVYLGAIHGLIVLNLHQLNYKKAGAIISNALEQMDKSKRWKNEYYKDLFKRYYHNVSRFNARMRTIKERVEASERQHRLGGAK